MSRQSMEFKTEVKQLLNLVINSLYSHKEIFLRELISNASDAIDKLRYESLTNKDLLEGEGEFRVKLVPDEAAGTLTISDNGIGMSREEVISELGTIAHSGTKEFLEALKAKQVKDNPELIGQFGVGFYSSFMVADRVTVITRRAGADNASAVLWESSADGGYSVEDIAKDTRGTDVVLHLKEDEKKYLQGWELRTTVMKYSDYIEHPIVMDVVREEPDPNDPDKKVKVTKEDTLNSMKALWLKRSAEVSDEEYNKFYMHVSHDMKEPSEVIHFHSEGTSEFHALLFIPERSPLDIQYKSYRIGPTLYVRRVQIMDHAEDLILPYLRFVKGVVDSSDLPLNVSREILQNNRHVEVMRKAIVRKVLDTLSAMQKNRYEKYVEIYEEFGVVLKEGIHYDYERREAIADLMLMQSTATEAGKYTTFAKYVEAMKPDQADIYYITGTSRAELEHSPYLESFSAKGYEVLFLTDDVDDVIMGNLTEYKGKRLKSIIKGEVELSKEDKEVREESAKKYAKLIELIRETLGDKVREVRLSGRLKDSPCCLVAEEGGLDHNMERLLRSMGQEVPERKKILELNPSHELFERMNALFDKSPDSPLIREYISILYGQALIIMGDKPEDPGEFTRLITKLMVQGAG